MEADAIREFESVKGRIILVPMLCGYIGNDSVEIHCAPPAEVRVLPTHRSAILHWNDEHLDPYWDVQLVKPLRALADLRSIWFDATTYFRGKAEMKRYLVKPPTIAERLWRWIAPR
jgi:hypothetical protein